MWFFFSKHGTGLFVSIIVSARVKEKGTYGTYLEPETLMSASISKRAFYLRKLEAA
jgi:hypothetical protein